MLCCVEVGVLTIEKLRIVLKNQTSYSLTFVIAGAAFSGSFPFYGMTKTMLSILPSLNMVFKTGGAIGHSDIGSIVVSGYDTT